MDKHKLPEFEIFKAGTHTAVDGSKVTITRADVAAVASCYKPDAGEAPLVVGHPKTNAPAYGWVESLRECDGVLLAKPRQVDVAFASMVNDGRYKKRSACFFLPDSPGNPAPGQLYLRHVGFLGAAAPAVAGLKDVSFADGEQLQVIEFAMSRPWWVLSQIAELFRRLRDRMIERDGLEAADEVLQGWQIDSIREAADQGRDAEGDTALSFAAPQEIEAPETVEFAARESAVAEREAAISARETALANRERDAKRQSVIEFAAGLVSAGRLLPRQQAGVVELLVSLDAEPATLSFAATDGSTSEQPRGDYLREFLAELPVQVDMTERGAGEEIANVVEFAAPPGVVADRNQLELLGKARAYQGQHPGTSLVDAVRAVGGH